MIRWPDGTPLTRRPATSVAVVVLTELHGHVAAFGVGTQQVPYVLLVFSEGTAVDAGEAERARSGRSEADGRLGAGPSGARR